MTNSSQPTTLPSSSSQTSRRARGAVVHSLTGGHDFCSRMANLGFTAGAPVTVRQNYGRGPIVVALRGTLVALGRAEAGRILVLAERALMAPDLPHSRCARRPSALPRRPSHPAGPALPATTADPAPLALPDALTIALVGQPNVGKSTVFNMLTGLNQHVGNWPGKTVEQKTGVFQYDGAAVNLVDLPGTYSLTANSEEERIARDYLISERPDVAIAIVNAATLERSLYLVAELLALDTPLVIGLNMSDVAEQHGIHVEPHVLEAALGVPVIPLGRRAERGHPRAGRCGDRPGSRSRLPSSPTGRPSAPNTSPCSTSWSSMLGDCTCDRYAADWSAMKLLEGDSEVTAQVKASVSPERVGGSARACCCSTRTRTWTSPAGATSGSAGWCARRSRSPGRARSP